MGNGAIPYRPMVRGHFDRFTFVNATNVHVDHVGFEVNGPSGTFMGSFAAVDLDKAPSGLNCGSNNEGLWVHMRCDAEIGGKHYIFELTLPDETGNIFFAVCGLMQDCNGNLMMFGEVKLEQGGSIALQETNFTHP